MRKVVKWIGIVLGGLVGLLVVVAAVLYALGSAQLNKTRDIEVQTIDIHNDEATLARGAYLLEVAACTVCHGKDLSGDIELDDPTIGTIYSSNISGLGATHSDADLIRAVRHGVDTDGRQLILMPSQQFINNLNAEDMGALIAYLKTVPRVGNDLPEPEISFTGRVLVGTGLLGDAIAAAVIDHDQPYPPMPEIGANVEYGAYLAGFCTGCHGADLGGQPAEPEFDFPGAPNLTPGGELAEWTEDEFVQTMRTGVSPHGHGIDREFMPVDAFAQVDEDELRGLWMYLQTVPPQ